MTWWYYSFVIFHLDWLECKAPKSHLCLLLYPQTSELCLNRVPTEKFLFNYNLKSHTMRSGKGEKGKGMIFLLQKRWEKKKIKLRMKQFFAYSLCAAILNEVLKNSQCFLRNCVAFTYFSFANLSFLWPAAEMAGGTFLFLKINIFLIAKCRRHRK